MAAVVPVDDKGEAADEEKKEPPPKPAAFGKMFSLATGGELFIIFVGVIGAIANGAAQPAIMLLMGDMMDGVFVMEPYLPPDHTFTPAEITALTKTHQDAQMDKILDMCIQVSIWGIIATAAGGVQGCCFKRFAEKMQHRMLTQYYHIVLHQDISWFDGQDPAGLPLQMSSDAQQFGDAFGDKMANSVMSLSTFIGGYVAAFYRGWPIALVMSATLPLLAVGGTVMGIAMQEVLMETQGWYGKAAAIVEETFYAMRTVIAFGGESREIAKYKLNINKARWGGVKNNAKMGLGLGYTMGIFFLSYALAFYFGMRLRYDDVENPSTGKPWLPGEILGVFFCVVTASFMLGNIEPGVNAFGAARVCVARFFVSRDNPPIIQRRKIDERKTLTEIEKFDLKDVHFAYPKTPDIKVLNGLTLSIKKGQKVAFVGESGSGKSTVMALLERFYDPTSGQVLINGEDVKNFSVSSLRSAVGYVGQEPVLFATSIRENIMQGAPGAGNDVLQKAVSDAQLGFLDDLPDKMDTYVGSGGLQLSGGQKQRIAIARALVKQAKVLFLDEATSALDNVSEKMIQETIDKLSKSSDAQSMTIVAIAHRLSTVRGSDCIFVLSKGVLAESGPHAELMEKQSLYYALVASQDAAFSGEDQEDNAAVGSGTAVTPFVRQASNDSKDKAKKATDKANAMSAMVENQNGSSDAEKNKEEEERQAKILKEYQAPTMRLYSFCKPEWPFLLPAILGSLYDGASQPVTGYLLILAMAAFQLPKEEMRKELEEVCLWFTLLSVGELFACLIKDFCFGMLGEGLTMRLRLAIFTKIFEQEMGFHDDPDHSPGSLSAALQIYAFRVSNLCKAVGNKAGAMASLVVGLTVAFVFSWQMSLAMFATVPIMIAANALQMVVMLGGDSKENEKLKQAQQVVSESVQSVRTVHACGTEKALIALYTKRVESTGAGWWTHGVAGFALGLSGGIQFFIIAIAVWVMAILVREGESNPRDVMISFMCVLFAAMGAGQCAGMMGDAAKATVAAHDAFKLLDRKSAINGMKELGPEPPATLQAGCIEFRNVKFHYPFRPDVKVLKGVTFTVEKGQAIGLCGPSGGGKSTLMCLLQRYYDPMEGSIHIGAEKMTLSDVSIRWWRQQIGFVGQEPMLFNTSVKENVMYGLAEGQTITDSQLEKCRKMAAIDWLDKDGGKGWETQVGPRGSHLSGGQKQRVAICRALVRDPKILLLDEATSALDSQSEKIVQEALEAARAGRTSFSIAHRLSTLSDCDIIMVVAEGTILEKGTHAQLMEMQGVYHKLQSQSQA
jgi:ATP-binding cassette subfamily B (MDR/TAP) protein 1